MPDGSLGTQYRAWIVRHAREGLEISQPDRDHIVLTTDTVRAQVSFYELDANEPEIVELRMQDLECSCEDLFFLHFELEDEERAEGLFSEMMEVLEQQSKRRTTRVLLCCTSGLTTTLFAAKLAEAAQSLSLDFQFDALPLEQAIAGGAEYEAILLAPQVGYRRKEVIAAYPDKVVFEIPAKIFGSYDAAAALHLLLGALDEVLYAAREASPDTKIERDIPNGKRILVISMVHRLKGARIGYRIYEKDRVVLNGRVHKRRLDYRDIEDVAAGIRMKGYRTCDLDMAGVALPGPVDDGNVSRAGRIFSNEGDVNIAESLERELGIPVLVENNANAAAVGCYVTQNAYENIVLHTQRMGSPVGGQGTIVNGRLVRGRAGAAGELGYVARHFDIWPTMRELCWSPEGMCKIITNFVLCNICTVAPEAVYVAVEMLPDMEPLRAELAKTTPEDFIPELIPVDDYHERIMIGQRALCLNWLRANEAKRES